MKIVSVAEMRAIEEAAQAESVSVAAMMEKAGEGIAQAIEQHWDVKDKQVLVLTGTGNNGGDGLVAGLHLAQAGAEVKFYLVMARAADDAHMAEVRKHDLFVVDAESDQRYRVLHQLVTHADLIVDALLGTGARLPLPDRLAKLLEQVKSDLEARRAADRPDALVSLGGLPDPAPHVVVVAVDLPSGLNADTGEAAAGTLAADLTVTMGFPKLGMLRGAGPELCGELVVAPIGLPAKLKAVQDVALEMATADWVRAHLPARPAAAHKDTFGRVLIVAGSLMYTGAAALAAEGAYRVGAGLVQVGVPLPLHAAVAVRVPEATFLLLPHDRGVLTEDAAAQIRKELEHYKAMLIGPGLGREESTAQFVDAFFVGTTPAAKRAHIGFLPAGSNPYLQPEPDKAPAPIPPLVVDADGLNLLANLDEWPRRLPPNSVLTPHPGEMSRLLKVEKETIQADRIQTAQRAAQEWGHVVVLKGAYTVVAAPDQRTMVQPWLNPGLAHAGTGDVLAGAIVGLMGQGLAPFDAAVCGAYLHGLAGHIAREELGTAGMLARDVAHFLAYAVDMVSS